MELYAVQKVKTAGDSNNMGSLELQDGWCPGNTIHESGGGTSGGINLIGKIAVLNQNINDASI